MTEAEKNEMINILIRIDNIEKQIEYMKLNINEEGEK